MPVANLHVTLVFVGTVDTATAELLAAAAATVGGAAFDLHIDTCGWWRRSGIGWLAPSATPAPLEDLVAALRALAGGVGVAVDSRPFRPHVTICRRMRRAPEPPDTDIAVPWRVRAFALVESLQDRGGTRYEVFGCWSLGASASGCGRP